MACFVCKHVTLAQPPAVEEERDRERQIYSGTQRLNHLAIACRDIIDTPNYAHGHIR